jgi:thymidylate synthase
MINKFQENPTYRQEVAVTWISPLDTKVEEIPFMALDNFVDNFEIRDKSAHITIFPERIM